MTHKSLGFLAAILALFVACGDKNQTTFSGPKRAECIAPAKPGGGFDLTCKLAQSGLKDSGVFTEPMRVTYMPGGVGAVAYNRIVANDRANPDAIVAFSTGSLLNLAQGKFGKFTEKDVKFLAAIGADYGMMAVKSSSKIKNLKDLIAAIKDNPKAVVFGAGASVGGQDWMQVALLAKAAGVDPKNLAYVAMEGGGEVNTALLGGHISVASGGLAEILPFVEAGDMRVLAVFAPERLGSSGEKIHEILTAKEQGFDIQWPVIRGFYLGPDVSPEAFLWWKTHFDKMLSDPSFGPLRDSRGLFAFALTGDALQDFVRSEVARMKSLSGEFGLIK